jgi:hypothetical protein
MNIINVRLIFLIASIFFAALCFDKLNALSYKNALESVSDELPRTSLVQVQPSTAFATSEVTPYTMSAVSTNSQSSAPLQISGQAVLATSQTLSPVSQNPVGIHVVDSPQGKACAHVYKS